MMPSNPTVNVRSSVPPFVHQHEESTIPGDEAGYDQTQPSVPFLRQGTTPPTMTETMYIHPNSEH